MKLGAVWKKHHLKVSSFPKVNPCDLELRNSGMVCICCSERKIFSFLWDSKPPKVKNEVITNSVEKGGLKVPHVDSFVRAQKAIWAKRMCLNDNACWLQLFKTFIPEMKIQDLLKCHINSDNITHDMPLFYRQVLCAWFDLKDEPKNALDIARETVWLNKYITINEECLFYKKLYQNGLLLVSDLLAETGKFLTHDEFQAKFNVTITHLFVMSLIDAIPVQWRRQLKHFNATAVNNAELPYLKINDSQRAILLLSSKDVYRQILRPKEGTPSCIENWNKRLADTKVSFDEWKQIFCLPKDTVRETRVLEVQFKILHRCYATRSKVNKWDATVSPLCTVCKEKANIVHDFYTCPQVQNFWQKVCEMLSRLCHYQVIELSLRDIIMGKPGVKHDVLNHVLLYAKYHIHKQICK